MGVHDIDKYAEIKRLLDIPEDEPIFIFRAQDMLMPDVIYDYRRRYMRRAATMGVTPSETSRFAADLDAEIEAVDVWQREHHEIVRVPD